MESQLDRDLMSKLLNSLTMLYTEVGLAAKDYFYDQNMMLPCMFRRATMKLNGRIISESNNYTQDNILSKRLSI